MIEWTTLRCVPLLAFCVLLAEPALAQPPTVADLAGLPAEGPLSASAVKTIRDYVNHWVGVLKDAKGAEEVEKACGALARGYGLKNSTYFQMEYATAIGVAVPKALAWQSVPLLRVKHVQLSRAVSKMEQIYVRPALDAMLAHGNPGVRYWAAEGYRAISPKIVTFRGQRLREMLATLEKAGSREPSGLVLAKLFRVLSPDQPVEGRPGKDLRDTLAKVWRSGCKKVQKGDENVLDGYGRSLMVIARVAQDDKTAALQLVWDLMQATSLALLNGETQKDPALVKTLTGLLTDLEEQAAKILALSQKPIQAVLADSARGLDQKAMEVRLLVNTQWKELLKARGVSTWEAVAPTTKPAATEPADTKPAG